MNWLKAIKRLLGRFWADIFKDQDFLLGVEYLMSLYSKLTDNQYINWRNGLIAANLDVAQANLPCVILIETTAVEQEWYQWQYLWQSGSAYYFYNKTLAAPSQATLGWIAKCESLVNTPDYMVDHVYGYNKILLRGSDYDYTDGRFLFYVNPATLNLPIIKETDSNGNLHTYYRLFGYALQNTKVCDPVTGFESAWLNDCSDIAWDIHTNGATYYNTKQLLGKATGSVICENDGTVDTVLFNGVQTKVWQEQDYKCLSVDGIVYYSKYPANINTSLNVVTTCKKGDVLFGSLVMYKGTDTVTASQVPGINVMTDAGELTALNKANVATYKVPQKDIYILPLEGSTEKVIKYREICTEFAEDDDVPFIQVPTQQVNPYEFVVKVLRRGRAVTVRLVADNLDYLAAAIKCLRKSSCAAGMINVYVATSADSNNYATLKLAEFTATVGMAAVAVDATVKLKEACAKAEIIL
jgi:hypothetical protein